ncbi:MAG: diadenylate cyclase CdaA [Planctomycetota bacterium]
MIDELTKGLTIYLNRLAGYSPWVVLVQLILIGIVVWWVMKFLRGTRGAGLVKGAAVLVAVFYLGIRLLPKNDEWKRLEFLFGRFLLFALVALAIAFQPELRRALIQIGQARFFRGARGQVQQTVDALVESAAYLSRNKIGALMAVERSVGLAALIQTGTILNARLHPALLNSIFYPGTALHDMGVVVRGNRVIAAGCQFPLAESEDVDRSLGSRHRAALGLAKDSDAVIMVISEETGRVSLAYEGQLHIGLEPENLREMLLGLLTPRKTRKARKRAEEDLEI